MARDYAKRPNKRKQRKSVSSWVWLLTGLLIGLVLAGIAYLKVIMPQRNVEPEKTVSAPPPTVKPEPIAAKPKFDFYTLLPEMEVGVPEKAPAAPAKPASPSKTLETAKYRLQLASFKSFEEADGMKARLALEGVFVEIQTVKVESGQTWYRVRTSLFNDRNEALALQKSLQKQAINSMLLKDG